MMDLPADVTVTRLGENRFLVEIENSVLPGDYGALNLISDVARAAGYEDLDMFLGDRIYDLIEELRKAARFL